jgi:hypothetical protein
LQQKNIYIFSSFSIHLKLLHTHTHHTHPDHPPFFFLAQTHFQAANPKTQPSQPTAPSSSTFCFSATAARGHLPYNGFSATATASFSDFNL